MLIYFFYQKIKIILQANFTRSFFCLNIRINHIKNDFYEKLYSRRFFYKWHFID